MRPAKHPAAGRVRSVPSTRCCTLLLHQDQQGPVRRLKTRFDLGGAKGTRTPGLLDANRIFCVFLRRLMSPDEPPTCGDCRRPSVDVARSRTPLALCLALLDGPSGSAAELLALGGSDTHSIAAGAEDRFPADNSQETAVQSTICLHWHLPVPLLKPSSWRIQTPLEHGRRAWASRHVAELSRLKGSRRRAARAAGPASAPGSALGPARRTPGHMRKRGADQRG